MNNQELDGIIAQMKQLPLPDCPGSLEANVLRRIRLSRADAERSLWAWFTELLPKPAFVAVALTMAVAVSAGVTAARTSNYTVAAQIQQRASSALDFGFLNHSEILNLDNVR
ncbi:hypothetical protein [Ruficoccus sp. ZRK36]|uniref:hypothetical protein n=1 Tax=Ruficoccus sp. ZRK36 TaxID=2866311 RepID=UPI001C732F47|nr:hypothetical protein [Ruficoccus sp. ZRK36]QYY36732.1 hypothetical protein K0V07_04470 [Ruficoccus sp. ZRK36]